MNRLRIICVSAVVLLSVFGILVGWSCFGYRNTVKMDYVVFTLDPVYEWDAKIVSNTDLIAIFDTETVQLYAVIGITGPFTSNELNEIIPPTAETETIGDRDVIVFQMPQTAKNALGIVGDYRMFLVKEGERGLAIFAKNEDKYLEETEMIIESLNLR